MTYSTFTNEYDLIIKFKKRDEKAFRYVFNMHYKALVYFTYKIVNDQQEAEDITTDSFLKLFDRCANFSSASTIRNFLYITCRNAAFDLLSKKKTEAKTKDALMAILDKEEDPLAETDPNLLPFILTEMDKLPPRCQSVFRLRLLEGLSTNQVATKLSMKYQTVCNQLDIAVQRIKKGIKLNVNLDML